MDFVSFFCGLLVGSIIGFIWFFGKYCRETMQADEERERKGKALIEAVNKAQDDIDAAVEAFEGDA